MAQEDKKQGQEQTDLAEGELETVEESLRIHEEKGDGQSGKQQQQEQKK